MRADLEFGTIANLVRQNATRFADLEAVVDNEKRLTYPQLNDAVREAARSYIACGIQKGDRVSIWAPNIWEWVIAALGAVTVGGVLVPLNTRFKGEEAAYILSRSRARMLLCVNGFLGNDYVTWLRAADTPTPSVERIVVMRGDAPDGTIDWHLDAGAAVPIESVDARVNGTSPDDLCDLVFTSGTTGAPKGVMVTHAQTLRVFEVWADVVGLQSADRYLIVNPFFHAFGYKAGWLACLITGATILPMPVFDAAEVIRRIAADRITVLPGPPTLFQSMLAHPALDRSSTASLRLAVTGAANVPVSLIERMRDELGFKAIVTGYGLTESTGTVSMCRRGDDPATIARSCGAPFPGIEVRIVNEAGEEVSRGVEGEIRVRGYNVMQGYLDDPAATAAAIDAQGWLHTGDIGTMDELGYLRITDRKKDMFIVGGFNAYPAEIENLLMGYDGIAQVAVVGVPDERMGEVGMAFVVPRDGVMIDLDALSAWAREEMANFKVPRHFRIVDALPTNASGKVVKVELRDLGRTEIEKLNKA